VINKKVEVRDSEINGKGLFAKEKILKDEPIWWNTNDIKVYRIENISSLPKEQRDEVYKIAYRVNPTTVICDTSIAKFMNHSCNANCWGANDGTPMDIARRDIEIDTEITTDYGVIQCVVWHTPFDCSCGDPNCRGTITENDINLPEIKSKYKNRM